MTAADTLTGGAGGRKKGRPLPPFDATIVVQSRSPVNAMINCSRLTKTL